MKKQGGKNKNRKEQKLDNNELTLEVCRDIVQILEQRREQINSKANILIAVNSALIAGQIQFLFKDNIDKVNILVITLIVLSFFIAVWSIYETINIIRTFKITPKTEFKHHLFFFIALSKMSVSGFENKVKNLTYDELVNEYATQTISLARNLDKRYNSLGKAYKLFISSLLVFSITVITVSIVNRFKSKPAPKKNSIVKSIKNDTTKNISKTHLIQKTKK